MERQLTDLNAILRAALGSSPLIPLPSRIAVSRQQLDDLVIENGTPVLVSIIGIQQDPHVVKQPMTVHLDRHPAGTVLKSGAVNVLAFDDGRRVCRGANFAKLGALIALAVWLDRMTIQTPLSDRIALRWDASLRQTCHGCARVSNEDTTDPHSLRIAVLATILGAFQLRRACRKTPVSLFCPSSVGTGYASQQDQQCAKAPFAWFPLRPARFAVPV